MTSLPSIYLASQSPRRAELLNQIGVKFDVVSSQIDESPCQDELPDTYVRRMAKEKVEAGWKTMAAKNMPQRVVLAADTIVELNGKILGKPLNTQDAIETLEALSGTTHRVLTAVAVKYAHDNGILEVCSVTEVVFRVLSNSEIAHYVEKERPLDKAGSYGIQGFAAVFAPAIHGSYTGIVGLPLAETYDLLREVSGG